MKCCLSSGLRVNLKCLSGCRRIHYLQQVSCTWQVIRQRVVVLVKTSVVLRMTRGATLTT
ncbi:hypothetical protein VPP93_gp8 [Vibrio phage VP93]|uniref:Uncharacterized protein n=1 Tax=Vibrio phage VP93 TaxID=641832 RepID=C3VVP8_9CAUD|nr:hypothetical protein VPP93_gp8 [Vibrio phage VP93]ACP44079.1 hypothetical protein VPP93_gp8 [Vibrio phage VP93]